MTISFDVTALFTPINVNIAREIRELLKEHYPDIPLKTIHNIIDVPIQVL